MKRLAATFLLATALLLWPASASADSASIDSVQDADGGQLTVTYTVTSTAVGPFGYDTWYATLAEDHGTRACNVSWANYLRHVGPLHEAAGSATNTVTFRPFFPRQIKLCIYLNNPAGHRAVFEQAVSLPAGYGRQWSTGYNCSHFVARFDAQDYFWLYPGDPSRLDADHDGAACESNPDPGPGPPIPAEPQPSQSKPQPTVCSDGIDNDGDGYTDLLDSYCVSASGTTEGPPPRRAQCNDGQDNDGDGAIDYPEDHQCLRRSDNREAPKPLPTLSVWTTKRYIRRVLLKEFVGAYRLGSFKRIARCQRISRVRIRCGRVSWGVGDLSYRGWVTIWYANDQDGEFRRAYAFRIRRTNGYCLIRKRAGDPAYKSKRCEKVHRAR